MSSRSHIRKAAFQVLRSRPREVALQVLYLEDLNPDADPAAGDAIIQTRLDPQQFLEFGRDELLEDDEAQQIRFNRKGLAEFGKDELVQSALESGSELTEDDLRQLGRDELAGLIRASAVDFARKLVEGVRARRAELDSLIQQAAENWSLERMAATDRNVLRLGAYELLHTDTPPRVAIDEAVELAKRFGTAQSGPFVNGILDQLMKKAEGGRQKAEGE
jgi:transcription antitermination factor NusB